MAYSVDEAAKQELQTRLKQLMQENEKLKLENHIFTLERQINEFEQSVPQTSTPFMPTSHPRDDRDIRYMDRTSIKPRKMRWTDEIVSDAQLTTDTEELVHRKQRLLEETKSPGTLEERDIPDRYVTKRENRTYSKHGVMIKPATYDGTGSWIDYRAHFETCAEINKWSNKDKGLYLAVALRGQAQGVFGNLSSESKDFDALVKALEERFAPPNQTELYRVQLRERRQKATESLSELGQDIRRLTNLAYATAPSDVRETLAKEQFIDALISSDMRLRVKQARPSSLNDAVRHAVELEAFVRAEKKKLESDGVLNSAASTTVQSETDNSEIKRLSQSLGRLEEQMKSLLSNPNGRNNGSNYARNRQHNGRNDNRRSCYECGSKSHFRRNCPKLQQQTRDAPKPGAEKKEVKTVNMSKRMGAGLFLPVAVEGKTFDGLVDTGATLSIISVDVWNSSNLNNLSKLLDYDRTIISASGTPLDVKGRANITLNVSGVKCEANVVVAKIENDVMLGLDFLQQNSCKIDIATNTMTIKGKQCSLSCKGSIGCYRVAIAEKVDVPAKSEMIVHCILVEEVIARFGVPNKIHSDQGRQFESALFSEMCHLLQIEKTRTTPYHPQSDGMVERFNRTLVTMLSAFVNSNHSDWDVQLPYVMMAYRAAEHETTGVSPNLCMLGRETTCPLDILYEMPSCIKDIPKNQWVWELQERLQSAHSFVRQNTEGSMGRQKRYHDRGLSFETFKEGDRVYVFFPVKKVGCSSKLTSYWRGPYDIVGKLSQVLYEVNCGRGNLIQVIHCDRLRKAKNQILAGEDLFSCEDDQQNDVEDISPDTDIQEDHEKVSFSKRKRTKPAWLSDYVLSTFSESRMVNTKTTVRKPQLVCPSCLISVSSEAFKYHVLKCVGKEYGCDHCSKTFKKKAYLLQHNKRKHGEEQPSCSNEQTAAVTKDCLEPPTSESSDNEDWQTEPDIHLLEEKEQGSTNQEKETDKQKEELQVGRVVRKRTSPAPVLAPKRRKEVECEVSRNIQSVNDKQHSLVLNMSVDINDKGKKNRKVGICHDGESVMDYAGCGAGSLKISLSEFVGKEIKISPEDVEIVIQGGEAKISIQYKD